MHIAVNLRHFTCKHFPEFVIERYHRILSQFLRNLSQSHNMTFVSLCDDKRQRDTDILKYLPDFPIDSCIMRYIDFDTISHAFAQSDIAITTRYHAAVMAIRHHIPLIALSYDKKSASLMKDLDLDFYSLPIEGITYSRLWWRYDRILSRYHEYKDKLADATEEIKASLTAHFNG
jgi:polysaccharide pyruvyl transferase WcaK-like protein